MPWTTRQPMSEPAFHARPDPAEPARKTARENIHRGLPPNRARPQADSGTAKPIQPERVRAIVDDLFMPLVAVSRPGRAARGGARTTT